MKTLPAAQINAQIENNYIIVPKLGFIACKGEIIM